MAVDKLVDSTQLDSDLTSVANAIRTKGGTSASLAFPSGFVSAINAISGGGGDYEIVGGTYTAATSTNGFTVAVDFQPTHAIAYCDQSVVGVTGSWDAYAFIMFSSSDPGAAYVQARTTNGNYGFAIQKKDTTDFTYENGYFKFAGAYTGSGKTFTWFCWRETT